MFTSKLAHRYSKKHHSQWTKKWNKPNDQQLMIAKTTEGLIKLANDGNNRIDEFIKKAYIQ